MSYDLMVFEKTKAPKTKKEFMEWYWEQTEWKEDHNYQSPEVASAALKNWFMEMKDTFPPMNGEYAPGDEALEDEELERHLTDYSIGQHIIYAAFSWSLAEEAWKLMRQLAEKHDVGFFDVSNPEGKIVLPDGTEII